LVRVAVDSLGDTEKFYLIATGADDKDADTLAHEICHARWYLDPLFRVQMDARVGDVAYHEPETFAAFRAWLLNRGYDESVLADELQAYFATTPRGWWATPDGDNVPLGLSEAFWREGEPFRKIADPTNAVPVVRVKLPKVKGAFTRARSLTMASQGHEPTGEFNLAMFGGRGAGRTTCALAHEPLSHAERYGRFAKVLFIRQTLRSLKEVEDSFQMMLTGIYGDALRVNRQDHIFTLPNGATIEFGPLNDIEDMAKLQGRSFSLIVADEYGNFNPAQQKFVEQLRANLRAGNVSEGRRAHSHDPTCQPRRTRPPKHRRQVHFSKMVPWAPHILDDGQLWMLCPGNYTDNPNLPTNYDQALFASAAKDRELFRAWSQGAWNIARGAMFAD
jgi:hypothetical protein